MQVELNSDGTRNTQYRPRIFGEDTTYNTVLYHPDRAHNYGLYHPRECQTFQPWVEHVKTSELRGSPQNAETAKWHNYASASSKNAGGKRIYRRLHAI